MYTDINSLFSCLHLVDWSQKQFQIYNLHSELISELYITNPLDLNRANKFLEPESFIYV